MMNSTDIRWQLHFAGPANAFENKFVIFSFRLSVWVMRYRNNFVYLEGLTRKLFIKISIYDILRGGNSIASFLTKGTYQSKTLSNLARY